MVNRIDILKGLHPGKLIERDLKRQHLTQRFLAQETGIPSQTINAVINGRRDLTTEQALKIEVLLGYDEGFLAILQTHYDIKRCKDKALLQLFDSPPRIRKSLFWDADFDQINWAKYKKAVIRRVLERGNDTEIDEITRFYHLTVTELEQYKKETTHPIS
ncbi:MAG: HigA family addiction module antitoxin [Bacteroidota bacterium]|nr:HigA family addiction module antitoxin [Bacteroidota bacterium]